MELSHARATCRCSDLHEFGSSESPLLGNLVLRLRLLYADRVSNTTDITLALVPEDYEVKPGRAGKVLHWPNLWV